MLNKPFLLTLSASFFSLLALSATAKEVTVQDVKQNYTTTALATFSDSLNTAKQLKLTVDAFVTNPTADNFKASKQAWLDARVPYVLINRIKSF